MKGRKRHIVVDILGNLLSVVVHAANIHDTKSGINPAKIAFVKKSHRVGQSLPKDGLLSVLLLGGGIPIAFLKTTKL